MAKLFLAFVLTGLVAPATLRAADPGPNPAIPLECARDAAVILYRKVHIDWSMAFSKTDYLKRIKILSAAGRDLANLQILYREGAKVSSIKAFTVQPDGTRQDFDGQIYDSTLAKYRSLRLRAKTLALPDVRPGTIIEYSYSIEEDEGAPSWVLSEDLHTIQADFSLSAPRLMVSRIGWLSQNVAAKPVVSADGVNYSLSLANVPRFVEEPMMPPRSLVEARVQFFRASLFSEPLDLPKQVQAALSTSDYNWMVISHNVYLRGLKGFLGKRRRLEDVTQEVIGGANSSDEKLRRIYARVQQIKNKAYYPQDAPAKLRLANSVDDTLDDAWGDESEICAVMVAMARVAGFPASLLAVTDRDSRAFVAKWSDLSQITGYLVEVEVDGKTRVYDPAIPFTPFGKLYWTRTGVGGMRVVEKPSNPVLISTSAPEPGEAVSRRRGALAVSAEGDLSGKLTVSWEGRTAQAWRIAWIGDETEVRRRALLRSIQTGLPNSCTLKLDSVTGLDATDEPLAVKVDVECPGFATKAGSRFLALPWAFYRSSRIATAQSRLRRHPVYYKYPVEMIDEIEFQAPNGYTWEAPPRAISEVNDFGSQFLFAQSQGQVMKVGAKFIRQSYLIPTADYADYRRFALLSSAAEESRLVLSKPTEASR